MTTNRLQSVYESHNPGVARTGPGILAALALVLMVLSSLGTLDDFAKEHVDRTTEESMKIFALSMSINAAISVLQSSQFSLIASIQIGELLDPINDAIERLSSVMAWAIGSLFLQSIVLKLASSSVFKWSFFMIGLVAILAQLFVYWEGSRNRFRGIPGLSKENLERYSDFFIRIFVVAAIFRFIIPVFVTISFLASEMLLGAEFDEHEKNLSSISEQIPRTGEQASNDERADSLDIQSLEQEKIHKESALDGLKQSLSSYEQESATLGSRIEQLEEKAGLRRWLPEVLGGAPPEEELESARARRDEIERKMKETREQIQASENDIECINRLLAGEDCDSWLDKLYSPLEAAKDTYTPILQLFDKINDMVINITTLLAAIIIKNILLPLIFLIIAVKCSLPIARCSVGLASGLRTSFRRDSKELKGYLERGLARRSRVNSEVDDAERGEQ